MLNLGKLEFVTGDLILTEVLQGFRTERDFRDARRALLSFQVFRMVGEANAIQAWPSTTRGAPLAWKATNSSGDPVFPVA